MPDTNAFERWGGLSQSVIESFFAELRSDPSCRIAVFVNWEDIVRRYVAEFMEEGLSSKMNMMEVLGEEKAYQDECCFEDPITEVHQHCQDVFYDEGEETAKPCCQHGLVTLKASEHYPEARDEEYLKQVIGLLDNALAGIN